ncbi:restriction endonuclease subunit M [Flaviflexus salsibiostraticola]|uniref:Restriction endonuclease subunit M n=1 Tax=Flaviflexus salsibiostraticola TaxID=1282737 RepID=A0A3Q8WSZ7_9ACTO|nr:N-6 DNA methylase [Flaviflexus salsibiostraticola]AZN29546.1 restriction endonuclease subunit M [Flaviflexus salsibiostraticola]
MTGSKFGQLADLGNESSVEQFFVSRLLKDLGYKDSQIKPKASIDELKISRGRKSEKWRPDYAVIVGSKVRWICEAKGVEENLDDWVGQSQSYCLALNSTQPDNPVEFFMLTNGVTTRVYRWDDSTPITEASFGDFVDGNQAYSSIRTLLAPESFKAAPASDPVAEGEHILRRRSVSDLNSDFAWAHRLIYKRDNLSYNAAFMEFVKVIFLKLHSDREAHADPNLRELDDKSIVVPAEAVKFSSAWIKSREADTPSPLDSILFQKLLSDFEIAITNGRKKRIFPKGERLLLSPDTLRVLVGRLEHVDLISIDADLNGRMFETFLNSTLRGKALGQYFTPRSVVKLATGLAQLRADDKHIDRVIDACSGTGGFLIEALADMWSKLDANASLSNKRREELRMQVAERSLIGVDVARDPALARIARINMYLHGDGGTSVYQLDSLDKKVSPHPTDEPEIVQEKAEFRKRLKEASTASGGSEPLGLADVALTNPPFAKEYTRDEEGDAKLLDDYMLSYDTSGGAKRPLKSLSSMIMFLERYFDLLGPRGRLVTVVDDSILGAPRHKKVREWIRKNWIIRAVVSLPGDAFQRSQARVKTSLIVLEKKSSEDEIQPNVFMYYCSWVGVDDPSRQRILPVDAENRERARKEIEQVSALYRAFQAGQPEAVPWTVSAASITDRFDVKACLPEAEARVPDWEAAGFTIQPLGELLELAVNEENHVDRVIDTSTTDDLVTYLRVRYDGFCEAGDEVATVEIAKQTLTRVRTGDFVFSHINAIHGAVAVVPEEYDGLVVTNEYTVCRPSSDLSASVIWALVRSSEARAEMLLLATGIGRTRVRWDELKKLRLPVPGEEVRSRIDDAVKRANEAEDAMRRLRAEASRTASIEMLLDSERSRSIIAAFKPPR